MIRQTMLTLMVLGLAAGIVVDVPASASGVKPRVIVSTDIGGSDEDDRQSMVHYMVYADMFDTEGLISSPPYGGRKSDILEMVDIYETDYGNLNSYSAFPTPQSLRDVTKQGAIGASPSVGYGYATEGSNWIISQANSDDPRPLYVLVWGSITDVAQAVHDDPSIKDKLRVYSIGSWNTDQDPSARNYLYNNHSDLWWIENDTTFRGMYTGGDQSGDLGNWTFVDQHVRNHGSLGDFFYSRKPDIKMGDTPSVLYLLDGDPASPTTEHWGGMFGATGHGPNFWTDLTNPAYREGSYDGAKTVNVHREDYLRDWQTRMDWAQTFNSEGRPTIIVSGWEFNTPGDQEGWVSNAGVANLGVADGKWNLAMLGPDPYLTGPVEADPIENAFIVEIAMSSTDSDTYGKIFWQGSDDTFFSEDRSRVFTVINDGEMHHYWLDISGYFEIGEALRQLRLDPVGNGNGGSVTIDYMRILAPEIPGDANLDGVVDDKDASVVAMNWLTQSGATWFEGDFNHDGKVDEKDATIMAANWQLGASSSTSVPEPSIMALLVGMILFCVRGFKR